MNNISKAIFRVDVYYGKYLLEHWLFPILNNLISSKKFLTIFMILSSLFSTRVSEDQTSINFQFHPTWTYDIYIYI